MCGIVGVIGERDVPQLLLAGLKRLSYRGYDSAGIVVIDAEGNLVRRRCAGKIAVLEQRMADDCMHGRMGIAHTRWATHGPPTVGNAHPLVSRGELALVHNGVIENHTQLRKELVARGYEFESETDSEVVAHLLLEECHQVDDLHMGVLRAMRRLEGAYALGIVHRRWPDRIVAVRNRSPLVVGIGVGEHFVASDVYALQAFTDRYIFLEEGDIAEIRATRVIIHDAQGRIVDRPVVAVANTRPGGGQGNYRHYLQKEIFEQPQSIMATLQGRVGCERLADNPFGLPDEELLDVAAVNIIGCGSSYYSAMVARYWIEAIAGVQCNVELASEYRYRRAVIPDKCLFVAISQSGETADTIAALQLAAKQDYLSTLVICNVPVSTLTRLAKLFIPMAAGPEISVASTKAVTSQLVILLLLAMVLGRRRGLLSVAAETALVGALNALPSLVEKVLRLDERIFHLARNFAGSEHALFLGRGALYPIAMEGALKLKELSYIHAEGYSAGELKHGPLAIIDANMPVIAVAAKDALVEKLKSNLHEVQARGATLYIFADQGMSFSLLQNSTVIPIPDVHDALAPILYLVPLQLLAYHVAVQKGTDVDQPRNLAKSVTVE